MAPSVMDIPTSPLVAPYNAYNIPTVIPYADMRISEKSGDVGAFRAHLVRPHSY